jgi:hypothetical protein
MLMQIPWHRREYETKILPCVYYFDSCEESGENAPAFANHGPHTKPSNLAHGDQIPQCPSEIHDAIWDLDNDS